MWSVACTRPSADPHLCTRDLELIIPFYLSVLGTSTVIEAVKAPLSPFVLRSFTR